MRALMPSPTRESSLRQRRCSAGLQRGASRGRAIILCPAARPALPESRKGHAQLMLPSAKTCRRNPSGQLAQAERLRRRCPVRLRHRSRGRVCRLHRGRKLGRRGQYPSFPRRCGCPPVLLPAGLDPWFSWYRSLPCPRGQDRFEPAPQIITIEWRSRHISLPTAPMCNHSRGDDLHRPLNGSDPRAEIACIGVCITSRNGRVILGPPDPAGQVSALKTSNICSSADRLSCGGWCRITPDHSDISTEAR